METAHVRTHTHTHTHVGQIIRTNRCIDRLLKSCYHTFDVWMEFTPLVMDTRSV